MPLTRKLAVYAVTLAVMLALDALWLGVVAQRLYQQGLGPLLAAQPRLGAAALFYLVYPLGLTIFAVLPHAGQRGPRRAAVSGALFGFFAYATYDLTNLATLAGWPLGLSLLDMAWGAALSAVAATAGKAMLDRRAG